MTDATDAPPSWTESPATVLLNFGLMTCAFAVNHGTVTTFLSLASTDLGKELAGVGSGTLYVFYVLSALTMAAATVQKLGPKTSLTIGLYLYCFYVASFLVAIKASQYKWYGAITGSTIGGIAAGWLWTAQGAFFSRSAKFYAKGKQIPLSEATSFLGALFATFYVGFEVILKALSSVLSKLDTNTLIVVYTIVAVASASVMLCVRGIPDLTEEEDDKATPLVPKTNDELNDETPVWLRKITLAAKLWWTDPKMKLLTPLNMAFGFTASFMNFYVNGTVITAAIGKTNVGFATAITPAVATLLSFPYSWLSNKVGKLPLMVFGGLNYAAIALAVAVMSQQQMVKLGWWLAFLYVLGGSGRAVFESTNKATFADFFPNDAEAAFANVIITSGGGSAFAYFIFPHLTKIPMALITGVTASVAVVCLFFAFRIHERGVGTKNESGALIRP